MTDSIRVPETSLYGARRPDAHECVMRVLDGNYLTRDALYAVLSAYAREDVDRSVDCGLYGGAIRMLSDGRMYRRRNA